MSAAFTLIGEDFMRARLARIEARFGHEVGRAMLQETEIEATECRRRTPVDTGALRGSVHVEGPDFRFREVSTHIVAGGPAAPYAPIVHEDLEVFHVVGEAKFIEGPLRESLPHMASRVGKRLERNMGTL